ncbi:hypothetical protein [Luteitalea pratensis]|uniref:hypothetical protein n=1 Tax=Luteitalea pratensis TaxID=1855912 RepID=UPI0012FF8C97|nr:hypothetical protein [Luteitalea pratensis]
MRFSSAASSVLLGLLAVGPVQAQSLRVNGNASSTVPAAPDYAAEAKGDPWDFDKSSDYVYAYSLGEDTPQDKANEYTSWEPYPTVQNGIFSGVTRELTPSVQMLFGGVPGAMNARQDTGLQTPIDAGRYVTLSFRLKRSWAAANTEALKVLWEKGRRDVSTPVGVLLLLAKGYDNDTARWINQNPIGSQGNANEWQVYRVRLTDPRVLIGNRFAGTPWNGNIAGLSVTPGSGPVGSTVQIDWMRLTAPSAVTLSWQSLGSNVVITATDGTQTVQVFPEDLTPLGNPPNPRAANGSFPDDSSVSWDYGHLTPGTWTITAAGTSASRSASLVVDASPAFTVLNPDFTGGEDMATTLIGDRWDLANREDVFRYTSPTSALFDIKNAAFTAQGLTGVAWKSGQYGLTQSDSQVRFFDDDLGARFALNPDQARRYHRLTFTIDYDIPVQPTFDPLAPRPFLEDRDAVTGRPGVGGMMRVIWRTAAYRGGAFAESCGLPVQDGGPRTYSIDLSAYAAADIGCAAEGLQFLPAGSAWGALASNITNFRLDLTEGILDTPFTLSNVTLAADDEPDAAGQFVVQWAAQDARYSAAATSADARVAIYIDTDTDPSSKRLVANNLPASAGAYIWDLAATPGGVTPGTYQVYVEMTDAAGYSLGKYASGPLQVARTYDAPMTLAQWQAFYGQTNMAADPDGDGVTNQGEFEAGTSPQIANRSELAEGSTGFFQERVAIANPENRAAIARVIVLFGQRNDLGEAAPPAPVVQDIPIAAYGRYTVNVNALPSATYGGQGRAASVIVESLRGGVVVERTMSFGDSAWGGHTGKALNAPATQWFLAEGAANGFFQTFILMTATGNVAPKVTVDFLLEDGQVVSMPFEFPSTPGRLTVWANELCAPGTSGNGCQRVLAGKAFSTRITADQPITVERAMYFNRGGRTFEGGHASAAVTAPATRWFVAEGATGPNFDTYLLVANPTSTDTVATVRYLTPEGAYTAIYPVRANSRLTLYVDDELRRVSGRNALATQIDVSAEVSAPQPIVVERAMYWFGAFQNWTDAHNSAGVTTTGTNWAMAEGQSGGALKYKTFVLIANPSASDATVQMRLLREGGRAAVTTGTFTVPANSRFTCYAGQPGPCQDAFAQLQDGEMFGVSVESVNGTPIVIERALYWDGGGEAFGAGTNETGVRIR